MHLEYPFSFVQLCDAMGWAGSRARVTNRLRFRHLQLQLQLQALGNRIVRLHGATVDDQASPPLVTTLQE